ncbi:DUF2911 domain-containing protein [Olivibacter sp. SDN3]|uniref:DUF2911 domain-containing protein n=1 Tax=Olivibacter sp. SDN3 TaxID=2764720 RepID=UPI001650DB77|nr:DUF2911 domain-containing protein [Olivibacter sp. SDN3]QNL51244.1 DUF2911 domain-containing protein [Olivibacter sp. SDN3]
MKRTFLCIATAMLFASLLSIETSFAQTVKLPAASSKQVVTQDLGISQVTLTYARPNTKGRKIFGGLEPYGEVWRTGANGATTLAFSGDVIIDGKKVAAGTYGLFTIPDKNEWTIILNKKSDQWGAYEYNQSDDVLRFKVKPEKTKNKVETFTIDFPEVTAKQAKLSIRWEDTAVAFDINVDQDQEIMASIDEAMQSEKKPYLAAAQYYFNNDKDLDKALIWADEALKANPALPYPYYWKAQIQLKKGDKAGAKATAELGRQAAEKADSEEYIRLNNQVIEKAK